MHTLEIQTDYKVLSLSSKAFHEGGIIPEKYTCEGKNINPPLDITGIPEKAVSLALIVEDPDAPGGTFTHWVVWNIPITHCISEDDVPGIQGANDFGKNNYGGPCPPSGTHRYFFKIYALNTLLNLPEGSRKEHVEDAVRDHILAYGELVGLYKKIKR